MSIDIELTPCPFCGSHAQTDFIEGESYIIECYACDARTGSQDSAEDAATAWNLRAAQPAPIPAQTEQQQDGCNSALRAESAGQHDATKAILRANEIMRAALENIAEPADAHCGCSFPCRCDDEGAEAIRAGWMRGEAADALAEVELATRCRAEGGHGEPKDATGDSNA